MSMHYPEQKYEDDETREFAQVQEQHLEGCDERRYQKSSSRRAGRDECWRDYARILYSSSFRRLQGKMQLLGADAPAFFRNRLTHSLEVCQIARGVASKLELQSPWVAEACSLAHDLGNPPFGHAGERVLDELARESGGYEGNAQTLRILTTLEKKSPDYQGLNLTLRTLLGVVKYDRRRDDPVKNGEPDDKFVYAEDYVFVHEWLREKGLEDGKIFTIDMQIMDLADEIAYAAHDLEDCLALGYFTIDELLQEFRIHKDYKVAIGELENAVDKAQSEAERATRLGSSEEYSFLFRKEMTSEIVYRLVHDVGVDERADGRKRLWYLQHAKLAEGLKKLIFRAVLRKPGVQLYERRGEKVIRDLFEVYADETYNKNMLLLSPEYRIYSTEEDRLRNVADYIGGMQDAFALQEHQRHMGKGSLDNLFESID